MRLKLFPQQTKGVKNDLFIHEHVCSWSIKLGALCVSFGKRKLPWIINGKLLKFGAWRCFSPFSFRIYTCKWPKINNYFWSWNQSCRRTTINFFGEMKKFFLSYFHPRREKSFCFSLCWKLPMRFSLLWSQHCKAGRWTRVNFWHLIITEAVASGLSRELVSTPGRNLNNSAEPRTTTTGEGLVQEEKWRITMGLRWQAEAR